MLCAELDPAAADCFQAVAGAKLSTDDAAGALSALEHCAKISQQSLDCRRDLLRVVASQGRCDDLRQLARDNPLTEGWGYGSYITAQLLARRGRAGDEAVENALSGTVERADEPDDVGRRLFDKASFKILGGAFEEAERELMKIDGITKGVQWYRPLLLLVESKLERGEDSEAVALARTALSHISSSPARTVFLRPEPRLLSLLYRNGEIDKEAFDERRSAWHLSAKNRGTAPMKLWLGFHGWATYGKLDADSALHDAPRFSLQDARSSPAARAAFARLLMEAERTINALPHLNAATRDCRVLEDPIGHVRSHYLLARALVETNKPTRACDAYTKVLHYWRASSSRTAKLARAGIDKLDGCHPAED